jgi:beta-ureidopropionase / N-carbamoyl-L-amino-acid hydrolase
MTNIEIDIASFLHDMETVAAFGRTADGGVCREAATPDDGAARDWLCRRFREEGLETAVDPVGCIYGVARLAAPDAPVVLTGSHLDSQPTGGRYDGAYGVVAGLHAVLAVRRVAGPDLAKCNIGVVNWTNEEGSRFAPSTMGSGVFAGVVPVEVALSARDGAGVRLRDALEAIGYAGHAQGPSNVKAYVEAHIEQGPVLERERRKIGVVDGNWGTAKFIVEFKGRAAHTGPTPMSERRDALLAAAKLIVAVRQESDTTAGELLSSVGRIDVYPNSSNVIAETVRVFVEFRDVDQSRLDRACSNLRSAATALQRDGITVNFEQTTDRKVADFDPSLRSLIEMVAQERNVPSMRLRTIAGHDAVSLATRLPSAMIFVPSAGGVSHNASEFTSNEDLVAGVDVLAAVLARLVAA